MDCNDEFDCFRWFENPLGQQNDLLRQISADLNGHVYCIAWQSLVDAFIYHHFKAGRMMRSLIHGCTDGGWKVATGDPEPWEAELLFDPARRKRLLLDVKGDADRAEIIDTFGRKQLLSPSQWVMAPDLHELIKILGFP